MISPTQLNYIFALLKHRNFQRAAEACHVTQPTLSMQLKKVEETIGYKIFDRDTLPITLTSEGERLLPVLIELQDRYEMLEIEVQKLRGNYKEEIRIGMLPTISNYLIPELYSKWKEELEEINLDIIELTTTEILEAMRERTIDAGILAGPLEEFSFAEHILYNEEVLVYAPYIKEKEIEKEDLDTEHPWLLGEGNCLRAQMIHFCNLSKTHKSGWNYEGGNLHLLTKMVKQEGGYTLIPDNYRSILNLEQKDIKQIKGHTPYRQIVGIHLKSNTKREAITSLMATIRRRLYKPNQRLNSGELLPWTN